MSYIESDGGYVTCPTTNLHWWIGSMSYINYNHIIEMSCAIQPSCIGGLVACSIYNPTVEM